MDTGHKSAAPKFTPGEVALAIDHRIVVCRASSAPGGAVYIRPLRDAGAFGGNPADVRGHSFIRDAWAKNQPARLSMTRYAARAALAKVQS